uniref:Methyltransferase domain-containing protein n=1 Tax=Hemiselmis andersenii TaxID=464988 RepID=A0A6U2CZN2_HEMAN|mmetsp:Transcript_22835/g.53087  ORF Transcript_22835/g.53087 Transcript_22835/m.53087 type:complete len:409 (+) Transcript_22835:25-1251(+)
MRLAILGLASAGLADAFTPSLHAPSLPTARSHASLGLSTAPSALKIRPTGRSARSSAVPMQMGLSARHAGALAAVVPRTLASQNPVTVAAGLAAVLVGVLYVLLKIPSRAYKDGEGTVGKEYDAWTEEGLLEYYWGEHIHLGYYDEDDRKAVMNPLKSSKVFKDTKYKFIEEMYKWSGADKPAKVLDVGCGIGGTSRYLANKLGDDSTVTGITLSPKQVERATALAKERDLNNVDFRVMDALKMEFEDNTFDLVWACESGEHMPDKRKYIEEMSRVLKPGGTLVVATWCQKEGDITPSEQKDLNFLYEEWAHPYFVSYEEYGRLMKGTGKMEQVREENWVKETITAWRHSIWVGVWDPWIVIWKGLTTRAGPMLWWKTIREIVTLNRMHKAFESGLMTYGMITAKKTA